MDLSNHVTTTNEASHHFFFFFNHVDVSAGVNSHGHHMDGHVVGKYTYGDDHNNIHISGTYGTHNDYNVQIGTTVNW